VIDQSGVVRENWPSRPSPSGVCGPPMGPGILSVFPAAAEPSLTLLFESGERTRERFPVDERLHS